MNKNDAFAGVDWGIDKSFITTPSDEQMLEIYKKAFEKDVLSNISNMRCKDGVLTFDYLHPYPVEYIRLDFIIDNKDWGDGED